MDVLPPLNFLTLHYTYFIATVLGCSLVFWGAATPFGSVAYVDALYMCASAMTGAGLNTVGPYHHAEYVRFLYQLFNFCTGQSVHSEYVSAIDLIPPYRFWISYPRFQCRSVRSEAGFRAQVKRNPKRKTVGITLSAVRTSYTLIALAQEAPISARAW